MIKFTPNLQEKNTLANHYEIVINFMEGDCDGYEDVIIRFHEDRLKETAFQIELDEFYKSVLGCITMDRRGRGGFDTALRCASYYKKVEDWSKYCVSPWEGLDKEDREKLKLEPFSEDSIFVYDIPTESRQFFYHSYYRIDVYYYDSTGNKFNVIVEDK